jgi:hypothetical protein
VNWPRSPLWLPQGLDNAKGSSIRGIGGDNYFLKLEHAWHFGAGRHNARFKLVYIATPCIEGSAGLVAYVVPSKPSKWERERGAAVCVCLLEARLL